MINIRSLTSTGGGCLYKRFAVDASYPVFHIYDAMDHFCRFVYEPFLSLARALSYDQDLLSPDTYQEMIPLFNDRSLDWRSGVVRYPYETDFDQLRYSMIIYMRDEYLCFLTFLKALNESGPLYRLLAFDEMKSYTIGASLSESKGPLWLFKVSQLNTLFSQTESSFSSSSIVYDATWFTWNGASARWVSRQFNSYLETIQAKQTEEALKDSLCSFMIYLVELKALLFRQYHGDPRCPNRVNYKRIILNGSHLDFLKTLTVLFESFDSFQFNDSLKVTMMAQNTAIKLSNASSIFKRFMGDILSLEHAQRPDLPKRQVPRHLIEPGRDMNDPDQHYSEDLPLFRPRFSRLSKW